MGREFFYCAKCQKRLNSDDVAAGRAAEVGDRTACAACLADVIAPLSFREQEQILTKVKLAREGAQQERRASRVYSHPPVSRPKTPTPGRLRAIQASRPEPARGGHLGLTVLLLLLAVVATLGLLFYFGEDRTEETAARPPAPPPAAPPAAPAPSTKLGSLAPPPAAPRTPLEKAREFARANPADFAGQIEQFRKAAAESEGTPLAKDAQIELDLAQKRQKEAIAADLIALDAETRAAIDREEFKKALDRVEQTRPRHDRPEWTQGLEMRIRDINVAAWKVFTPLRDKALDARKRGAADELKAVAERVAKWGIPNFTTELEKSLILASSGEANPSGATTTAAAPAPPPPAPDLKPLTEEARTYQGRWQVAMDLAGARDFDAALRELDRAAAAAQDPALKEEAKADLELLRAVAALHRETLQILQKWPRGEKISIEFLDDTANLEKAAGPFVRADAETVELTAGGVPLAIELAEVAPRCLAALFKGRPGRTDADLRTSAVACLLEGDAIGARTHLMGPQDAVPAKYWLLSSRIEETRLNPATEAGKKATEARKLYFAAEREHREMKTRGQSIEKYRALLNEFADTPVVKKKRARIAERRETAREYVFLAPDFAASGTFKITPHPKLGAGWVSSGDADPKKGGGRNNWIEFEFYALQDAPYKAWIMAGGCCQEVFACTIQATELTAAHPQTKEKLAVEPGGDLSLEVKNSIPFLKARHEIHGGPKEAKRWEWIALPLPKYASAGLKKVRILTDQKGFGVAWAAVSTGKSDPPRDSEMKELVKLRLAPEEEPAVAAAAAAKEAEKEPERDPSLVAHWRLEDTGGTAVDASGHDNTGILTGDPEKVPGKIGGALSFDGKDRYVNIPSSGTLENVQEGSYTMAAWFKPSAVPAAGESYAIIGKSEKFVGLRYGADQKFAVDHWLSSDAAAGAVSASTFAPGTFYHVTGVVNRADGTTSVYVNGKLEGTASWTPNAMAKDFGTESWKIGLAALGRWTAHGVVDDVRIYTRALAAADVRALAEGARK